MVENASGVTGPSIAASRIATTRRASSTVEMNGISRRSNRRSGNWISSALPIVSALIPVLSERKNTGTAGRSGSCSEWAVIAVAPVEWASLKAKPAGPLVLRQA